MKCPNCAGGLIKPVGLAEHVHECSVCSWRFFILVASKARARGSTGPLPVPSRQVVAALDTAAVDAGVLVVDLLFDTGLARSKTFARQLVEQGGVRVGDRRVASVEERLLVADVHAGALVWAGKKQSVRLSIK